MAKGGSTQTVKQTIDPGIKPYRDAYLQNAFGYAYNAPQSFYGIPGYSQAPYGFGFGSGGGVPGAGGSFMDRLRGAFPGGQVPGGFDPNATFTPPPNFAPGQDPYVAAPDQRYTDMFMNPYEDQVIGGIQAGYDRDRTVLGNRVNDLATKANAFGGSRHAVLESEGLRDLAELENRQIGDFRYAGFQNSLNAGMGLRQAEIDAARQRFEEARDLPLQRLAMMQGAITGVPQGSTQRVQESTSPFNALLGAGLTAGSFFLPGGPLAGGGWGALGKKLWG